MVLTNGKAANGMNADDGARNVHRLFIGSWKDRCEVGEWIGELTADTPLRFSTAYIRHPQQVDGEWNCRWIEYVEWTNYYGERVRYTREPKRNQFNTEYLRWRLQHYYLTPKMTVSFRTVISDVPDSPAGMHVEFLEDVVNLETAVADRILTRRRSEGEEGVFAIVERSTGIVLPVAEGLTLTVDRSVPNEVSLDLRYVDETIAEESRVGSFNGFEKYESGMPEVGLEETYRDIARWSDELGRHIDAGQGPCFAGLRRAVAQLKRKTAEYDLINE